jgi:uncharacterized membrane protein
MAANKLSAIDFNSLTQSVTPKLGGASIGSIIGSVANIVLPIAGFALLILLISSGYAYMTSLGDPKAIAKAQSGITSAIIGFIIVFAAYIIVNYFGAALGIKQIQEIFVY